MRSVTKALRDMAAAPLCPAVRIEYGLLLIDYSPTMMKSCSILLRCISVLLVCLMGIEREKIFAPVGGQDRHTYAHNALKSFEDGMSGE